MLLDMLLCFHYCGITVMIAAICLGGPVNRGNVYSDTDTYSSSYSSSKSENSISSGRREAGGHRRKKSPRQPKMDRHKFDRGVRVRKKKRPRNETPQQSSESDTDDTINQCKSNWGREMPYVKGTGKQLKLKKRPTAVEYLPNSPDMNSVAPMDTQRLGAEVDIVESSSRKPILKKSAEVESPDSSHSCYVNPVLNVKHSVEAISPHDSAKKKSKRRGDRIGSDEKVGKFRKGEIARRPTIAEMELGIGFEPRVKQKTMGSAEEVRFQRGEIRKHSSRKYSKFQLCLQRKLCRVYPTGLEPHMLGIGMC
ncbi:unnamed protein product [Nippostrongylus brasiliensis]|uniref:Uncharacterized protein n=1 Tax=Nippostrongylus brasiliensis TaxID=27835 RepID=A0A0N4XCU1_NIPBR|nr:unnamed protein product [Nippostrongylus brasiliensis]